MKIRIFLPLCVCCALLLAACGTTEVTVNRNSSTPAAASSPASTPATAVLTSREKIGIPECDDFIAAYDACISGKVPEAARAQYKTALEQWRTSWKQLSGNPATSASLAAACKQSAEQTKAAMKAYNCTF
ncbi:MAG: hypothetical protein AABN95_21735 [Acidobacteriota bacterium]